MHTFKTKLKARPVIEERQTLDAKHNNMLTSFEEVRHNITNLNDNLKSIIEQLEKLNQENTHNQIINMAQQRAIWALDDKKRQLEQDISKIQKNEDENAYMLKTGKLLSSYYKILNTEKQIASGVFNSIIPDEQQTTILGGKKKTITDWFSNNSEKIEPLPESIGLLAIPMKKTVLISKKNKEKSHKDTKDTKDTTDQLETATATATVTATATLQVKHKVILDNKDTIYEKYMKSIDKTYINNDTDNIDIFDCCPKCMVEMLLNNNTGLIICPKCGLLETIIVDSDKPSFKEPPKEMTSFCYKRINHLNEFLAQFQAKETTNIPEDVYNEILMEIQKERITNMAKITPKKMRLLLKKIHKNDYYEHVPYIINQLNGLPAPVIAQEVEEIIRGMFKAIQIPFEIYCPNKRKNFLSYNYVMYKFFELLELDEYLKCFQLLKSRTKLHQQDQIWKNICLDLNWQFIKSL